MFSYALSDFQILAADRSRSPNQAPGQNFYTADQAHRELRAKLVREEAAELSEALLAGKDAAHVLKEICDLIYVTVGTSVVYGFPLEPAFLRVHQNNMLKLKNVTVREDGKIVKDPNHPKVDLSDLVPPHG